VEFTKKGVTRAGIGFAAAAKSTNGSINVRYYIGLYSIGRNLL
jgi:hypothetical protein